jgi:hypothetical protein
MKVQISKAIKDHITEAQNLGRIAKVSNITVPKSLVRLYMMEFAKRKIKATVDWDNDPRGLVVFNLRWL